MPVVDTEFDEADYDRSFYGLYGLQRPRERDLADLYYLGFDDERQLAPVASDFSLHTVRRPRLNRQGGRQVAVRRRGRLPGRPPERPGPRPQRRLHHGGRRSQADQGLKWNPTLWFYFDYASGNDAVGDFERFNQLFPLAHKYLGFIDAVARSNVVSPNVLLTMKPHAKWNLLLWYYYFGAAETEDIIPGVAVPSNAAPAGEDDFGQELDFIAKYTISPRSNILFGYSHLWRGQ